MGAYWGLSAQEFAALYAALVLVPPVVRLLGPALLRYRRVRPGAERVTAVELAVLAGGPDRAVDLVLADLVRRRWIRVDSGGRLTTTTTRPPGEPLAVAVVLAVSFWRGLATARTLRLHLANSPQIGEVVRGLAARGLVVPPGDVCGIRIASRVLLVGVVVSTFLGGYAVAAIPVMLAGMLVLGAAELVPSPRRTVAGSRLLHGATVLGTATGPGPSNGQVPGWIRRWRGGWSGEPGGR
ncbi:TIGR04222 domain-containing membrane protein [Amycolatopsis thermoflava]|uniref:TIGR04222 domain-containing membrane protein n=1 Tax=Amycolatopsis thermoflava TaxID=84480 RepID=UPI0038019EDD